MRERLAGPPHLTQMASLPVSASAASFSMDQTLLAKSTSMASCWPLGWVQATSSSPMLRPYVLRLVAAASTSWRVSNPWALAQATTWAVMVSVTTDRASSWNPRGASHPRSDSVALASCYLFSSSMSTLQASTVPAAADSSGDLEPLSIKDSVDTYVSHMVPHLRAALATPRFGSSRRAGVASRGARPRRNLPTRATARTAACGGGGSCGSLAGRGGVGRTVAAPNRKNNAGSARSARRRRPYALRPRGAAHAARLPP
jgi:hypothetical protein